MVIIEDIRRTNRDYSAADIVFYFSENFPLFTHGTLLIVERLADYYRTGELIDPVVLFKIVLLQHLGGPASLWGMLRQVEIDIAYHCFWDIH